MIQDDISIPLGFILRRKIFGNNYLFTKVIWSPDGSHLASVMDNSNIGLQGLKDDEYKILVGHVGMVFDVAFSPDGSNLASASDDWTLRLWNTSQYRSPQVLKGHEGPVHSVAWSLDGQTLVSGSKDTTIRFWNINDSSVKKVLHGHTGTVYSVIWHPQELLLASGSEDSTIRLWDTLSGKQISLLSGHYSGVLSLDWSPTEKILASASYDRTIRIWDIVNKKVICVLEGHTSYVSCISFSSDGNLLASKASDGTVRLWRCDSWQAIATLAEPGNTSNYWTGLDFHPQQATLATLGGEDAVIRVWDLDYTTLLGAEAKDLALQYMNAKMVLLGDSGVGKSALGTQIAEGKYRPTEGSTHSAQFWQIPVPQTVLEKSGLSQNTQVEITLWDLAGQPEYRVTHQLFLDDVDIALLLFDCSDPADPFRGVQYWVKVLKKHASSRILRVLISSRCDVSPVTVAQREINQYLAKHELDHHLCTSARTRKGVDELLDYVLTNINWANIPRITTPYLFQLIRHWLLEQKQTGEAIISLDEVWDGSTTRFVDTSGIKNIVEEAVSVITRQLTDYVINYDNKINLTKDVMEHIPKGCKENSLLCQFVQEYISEYEKTIKEIHTVDYIAIAIYHYCLDTKHIDKSTADIPLQFRMIRSESDTVGEYLTRQLKGIHPDTKSFEAWIEDVLSGIPWPKVLKNYTPSLPKENQELHSQDIFNKILADNKELLTQSIQEYLYTYIRIILQPISVDRIRKDVLHRFITKVDLETVIGLLQARGMVYRLDPNPKSTLVLLKPELINQYTSSIIQAARNHPKGIGAILERHVLTADFPITGFNRLPIAKERIVLEAVVELLIQHDLCFREMGLLVFPSQINASRPISKDEHPRNEVTYQFSGSVETIYASLVVRLNYTDYFKREDQWKWAVEFSRGDERLGFSMHQVVEGTGELEIYFDPGVNDFDRVTFIRFITDHLHAKGIDIQERLILYCHQCGKEVNDLDAIQARVAACKLDIPCQYCAAFVLIPHSIEERYQENRSYIAKQLELAEIVQKRTETEIVSFKKDIQQYTKEENDDVLHVLHLSDLHIHLADEAHQYFYILETDLTKELRINRLEYLVISGDFVVHSSQSECEAAFDLIDGLVKRFGLEPGRVILAPGNHDVNMDFSEESYEFIPKRKLLAPLLDGRYIPAGDAGNLIRNDELYKKRFLNFNTYLYKKVYLGQEYPLDYSQQGILTLRPNDRILFISLNSAWEIDHFFSQRAKINLDALGIVLNQIIDKEYEDWLKIAIFHHPVTGRESMNDEFMQLLSVHNFQICLHGHIHEAADGFYKYDDHRCIHIVGAGTFGAPTREQTPSTPLQYNLMTLYPDTGKCIVETRKKEKPNGAWMADARWGDKNNPKPRYEIQLNWRRNK